MHQSMFRRYSLLGIILAAVWLLPLHLSAGDVLQITFDWENTDAPAMNPKKPVPITATLQPNKTNPTETPCIVVANSKTVVCMVPTQTLSAHPRVMHLEIPATADFPYTAKYELALTTNNLDGFANPIKLDLKKVDPKHSAGKHTVRVVVLNTDKTPAAGAWLVLLHRDEAGKETQTGNAKSDVDGNCTLDEVTSDTYILHAERGDGSAVSQKLTITQDATVTITLPASIKISGLISGLPLPVDQNDTLIAITPHGEPNTWITKRYLHETKYALAAVPGNYDVYLQQDHCSASLVASFECKADQADITLNLKVPEGGMKLLSIAQDEPALSDPTKPPAPATDPAANPTPAPAPGTTPTPAPGPVSTLTIVVKELWGKGIEHAYVTVDRLTDHESQAGAVSAADGSAVLEKVPAGKYVLRVHTSGKGGHAAHLEPITVAGDATINVKLEAGVELTGTISGMNLKNGKASVSFVDTQYGLYCGKAVVERDFTYKINLMPGEYKVKFTQDAFFDYLPGNYTVPAEGGKATHDIAIPPKTLKPLLENDPNIVE